MVGGRKHLEPTTNTSSSESYFPDRIYNNLLEDYNNLKHDSEISLVEEETGIARKMTMVGLWCIQINPRDRPSMTKVLEMFSGNTETIPMPPKPFFLSPSIESDQIEMTTSTDGDP
ncbi:LEAF RUST 10 DISEASE-RESISTANCE LOCUS RECEPTOR-LIKE PROTEIN KINASE-like 2.1, partial [Pistacia vera]|uniref:LEAF RUST 10 DISEASE-RESISTANCE LOCUS RECEPTOR-LIKE PROTEIN KINASE-like 2.1 n=1 Tax=Pistacia vera TaxID=55513 RepID=UPI0012639D54